jgi:hypothetical protein
MKRHKWEKGREDLKNRFTKQQQCSECGLFRFKAMNMWVYSTQKTTDDHPFVEIIQNPGCLDHSQKSEQ